MLFLPQKEDAERLTALFPKGCMLMSWNGRYLGVNDDQLTKRWTWGGTRRGFGLYPRAMLDPAMDFQDRLNDAGNTEAEYYDRMAVPGVAYDANAIAGKGLSGGYLVSGARETQGRAHSGKCFCGNRSSTWIKGSSPTSSA